MTSFKNKLLIVCFLVIIFGMGLVTLYEPDREVSEVENRKLSQLPEISKSSLVSGELFKSIESYFTDQFYGRDWFIKTYTQEQILMGKTLINNVIIADDNWLFSPPIEEENRDEIIQSTNQLKLLTDAFVGENVEFYMALAPHKINMLMDKYPSYLNKNKGVDNQNFFLEHLSPSFKKISLYDEFTKDYSKKEIEKMYFKTDHHWNIEGAFAGYQYIINSIGSKSTQFNGTARNRDDYSLRCNEEALFVGSTNNQLYKLVNAEEDKACQLISNMENGMVSVRAKMWDGSEVTDINEIYGTGFNKEQIFYGDLFTWDLPLIQFEFEGTGNDLHLLVLKDSYGNPMQPFLAQHFKQTSILDLRHYKEKRVEDFIKENGIGMVLFLYNDTNLSGETYEVQ
jgi:hypothetical protein